MPGSLPAHGPDISTMGLSTADAERAFWDAATRAPDGGHLAIWGEPGRWTERIPDCIDACVSPALDLLPTGRRSSRTLRVLDLGCGIGRLAIPVARRLPNARIVGVDVSPMMLAGMKAAATAAGIYNVDAVLCDGRSLPADLEPVDVAYSMVVFQHIPWDAVAGYIRAVGAALAPGGVFRFQFVEGVQTEFLGNHFPVSAVVDACEAAGLRVTAIDRGLIYDRWCFVTSTRRS